MAEPLLVRGVRAGYGDAVVLNDISFDLADKRQPRGAGAERRRQVDAAAHHHGLHAHDARHDHWRAPTSPHAATPARPRRPRLGRAGARDLSLAHGRGKPHRVVARRPLGFAAVYELFPRLAERRANKGNQLSGGEQQMLAIARALMTDPSLLLLDEPFEGLAPIIVEELDAAIGRKMLAEQGTAFILVEQHAEIALSLTQNAIVMERGNVVHRAPSPTCSTMLRRSNG